MKIVITAPSPMELAEVAVDGNSITITPLVLKQQNNVRVMYIHAQGENGVQTKAVVSFNTNNGTFSVQSVDAQQVVPAFDRPVSEFNAKLAAARAKGQRRPAGETDAAPPKDVR